MDSNQDNDNEMNHTENYYYAVNLVGVQLSGEEDQKMSMV